LTALLFAHDPYTLKLDVPVQSSLGYMPSNAARDGGFHRIEIKTARDGLHMTQSRDGYDARALSQN
jgi:hypothetical protein